jgi:lipopolysaccharide export system protein LptC
MEVPAEDPLGDLRLAPLAPSVKHGAGVRAPWRVRDVLSAYLPVLLMVLLALSTWWLVKNTPVPSVERPAVAPRHEPDYTMERFSLQRFAPDGRLRLTIEGDVMRHYPDTDTVEIDGVRLHGYAVSGQVTEGNARRAVSNSDGSEVQLLGGAHIVNRAADGSDPIEFEGEFLHAFLQTERVRSHLPVVVRRAGGEIHAEGFDYDNLTRLVHYKGRVHAVFAPPARGAAKAAR